MYNLMLENEGKEQTVGAYWKNYNSPDVFSHSALDLCWNRSCLHLLQLSASLFQGKNAKSAWFYSVFYKLTILEFLDFYAD